MLKARRQSGAVCCFSRRMRLRFMRAIGGCFQRHRRKIAAVIHPLSALVLLSIMSFLVVYDLWFVLPDLYGSDGVLYKLHWLLAVIDVFNILDHMWACHRTDTSVGSLANNRQFPAAGEAHLWHYCSTCKRLMPPRSWHCQMCHCCIVKRDHHCTFAANCIGHSNQRYFLGFLFYACLGCGAALFYNAIYAWTNHVFLLSGPLLIVASIPISAVDADDFKWKCIISIVFKLNLLTFVVVLFMFVLQTMLVLRNSTCHGMMDRTYDLGWRRNLEVILGRRRFWAIISPRIKSPLPHDGVQWEIKQSV
ncbi:hypothetical protein KR009_005158 [Drosophila setifemur]|nr:hypothetical protein KR009_005158 [Drosophila setifemur]